MAIRGTRKSKSVPPPSQSVGTAAQVHMRTFVLDRQEDVSGTSGVGTVAEGVLFSNGQVIVHFLSQMESINVYANMTVLESLHGHDGRTKVRYLK